MTFQHFKSSLPLSLSLFYLSRTHTVDEDGIVKKDGLCDCTCKNPREQPILFKELFVSCKKMPTVLQTLKGPFLQCTIHFFAFHKYMPQLQQNPLPLPNSIFLSPRSPIYQQDHMKWWFSSCFQISDNYEQKENDITYVPCMRTYFFKFIYSQ